MRKISESNLYEPVRDYLSSLGYDVKAEVRGCDVTAVKGDELIVVELKTGFTMELIYQGLERQRIAESVYLAVPLPKRGYMAPRYHDMLRLCRKLELGLIFVGFTSEGKPQIDVAVNPEIFKGIRKDKREMLAVLTEHNGRTGSLNTGGVTRRKIMTVYKEQALRIAKLLRDAGEQTAAEVRAETGIEKAAVILGRNYYKWYAVTAKIGKNNIYAVTEAGLKALKEYEDLL